MRPASFINQSKKMNKQELKASVIENINAIHKVVSPEIHPDEHDIDGVIGHGMELSNIMGLCAKTIADAKKLLGICENEFLTSREDLYDSPTVLKKLMDAQLADENSLVTWADRLMAASTHKMDFYRSIVSKYKEELKLNNTFNPHGSGHQ